MPKSRHSLQYNRRDFLRLVTILGGSGILAPFLEACTRIGIDPTAIVTPTQGQVLPSPIANTQISPEVTKEAVNMEDHVPSSTPEPTSTASIPVAKIAFVKTADRAGGVRKAIELLGINPVSGKSVFLKPNFNSAHPAPGSTHPDVLRTLVTELDRMGARGITVGDRSGMGDTRRVMEQLGVFNMGGELGFETVVFDELESDQWTKHQPAGSHWKDGFLFPQPCLECDAIVQACCLKTHQYGGVFTMSLKNSVGLAAKYDPQSGYNYMTELHNSPHQRRMIAEINTVYSPALVVMDGVEAFVTGGPHEGKRVNAGLVLAGTDRVALDAVGVAVLQYFGALKDKPVFQHEQIARAVELGLGVTGPEQIELVTGDAGSEQYSQEIKRMLTAV